MIQDRQQEMEEGKNAPEGLHKTEEDVARPGT
jgi:hypothetical protein